MRHGFGLLIGADAPQLSAQLLGEACGWLASPLPRFALGPAHDGGFWLFGGHMAPPLAAWNTVTYSAANTARELQHHMRGLGAWCTLPALTDADHGRDLPAVLRALQALPDQVQAQAQAQAVATPTRA